VKFKTKTLKRINKMKNTIKLAVVAFAFAAFTTSCNKTEKTVESTTESVETTVDEAVTPEAGDTAVVIDQEADAVVKDTTLSTDAEKH
jgi:hypothetical protein